MESSTGNRSSWARLKERHAGQKGEHHIMFMALAESLADQRPDSTFAAHDLWAIGETMAVAAIMSDRAQLSQMYEAMQARLWAIADTESPPLQQSLFATLAVLAISDSAIAAGHIGPEPQLSKIAHRLLDQRRPDERTALYIGWAGLAHGLAAKLDTVLPFALGSGSPGEIWTARTAESFVKFFIRCAIFGCDFHAQSKAWRAWIEAYPDLLSEGKTSWPELLWSARVMHVVIGAQPEETLLDWLQSEIP